MKQNDSLDDIFSFENRDVDKIFQVIENESGEKELSFGVLMGPFFENEAYDQLAIANVNLFTLLAASAMYKSAYTIDGVMPEVSQSFVALCDTIDQICSELDASFQIISEKLGYKNWKEMSEFGNALEKIKKEYGTK